MLSSLRPEVALRRSELRTRMPAPLSSRLPAFAYSFSNLVRLTRHQPLKLLWHLMSGIRRPNRAQALHGVVSFS
jgi:hypothetical protein